MKNEENAYQQKGFNYGFRFRGNMVEVKLRFSEDIANIVNDRFKCENMFKGKSADGYNLIYGHVNPQEYKKLRSVIDRAKAERHYKLATEYLTKSENRELERLTEMR